MLLSKMNLCRNLTIFTKRGYSSSNSVGYKSSISLQNLYPNSSLKITTPEPPKAEKSQFSGYIPTNELEITYSRSTGPGGQNVNKVNTKVEVRFNVDKSSWIPIEAKSKLLEKFQTKITKDGFMVFRSDLTRYQQMNLADCLEKIRTVVRNCLVEPNSPSEESLERARRRFEKATRERLAIKRIRSQVKSDRQAPII